ncbi:ATP-binding cassette domain-containing protein [Litoribacillus peritrichatus]|uniref:Phosphonate ABC transporter ATP-binding protein n=1 Tax=Litoribacillus peritrichatus TaxID=718191 RepID=A0ABP7M5Y1_9GAMM
MSSVTNEQLLPIVSIENEQLSYASGKKAQPVLSDLNLTIQAGERIALVGKSGCGKSTLLRHLRSSLKEPAWCPQDPGLVPMLSVLHNIYMGKLNQYSWITNLFHLIRPSNEIKLDIQAVAQQLEIANLLQNSVDQLSGGQQQRVALGRALYQQSDVFLGDEPLSAVDELQAKRLLDHILSAHETAIIALHDVNLAFSFATRIIGLKDGQIEIDQATTELTPDDLMRLY